MSVLEERNAAIFRVDEQQAHVKQNDPCLLYDLYILSLLIYPEDGSSVFF
jgi:hypothetical protein